MTNGEDDRVTVTKSACPEGPTDEHHSMGACSETMQLVEAGNRKDEQRGVSTTGHVIGQLG